MCARQRLPVIVIGALAACAAARPGANDIQNITKFNVHDKSVLEKDATQAPPSMIERFPHAVLYGFSCGGTIISPNWVLTAAHCSRIPAFTLSVLAGTDNTADGSGTRRNVKRTVIHPLFTVGPLWLSPAAYNFTQVAAWWDFMLAELKEPLPLDNKTMIAARIDESLSLPEGLDVEFGGYGTDRFGGSMTNIMHEKELEVQSEDQCSQLIQYDSNSMICAKGRPPRFDTACAGDSGSGLVDDEGNLIGVMSWVQNDAIECKIGNLVVAARVAAVRDWIRDVTGI